MTGKITNSKVYQGCVDRKDAAAYIACSTRLLDNLATSGEIPRIKIGRKSVFRVKDLDAYLESKVERSEVEA